jgi:hypothetical protein
VRQFQPYAPVGAIKILGYMWRPECCLRWKLHGQIDALTVSYGCPRTEQLGCSLAVCRDYLEVAAALYADRVIGSISLGDGMLVHTGRDDCIKLLSFLRLCRLFLV